ncbi:MAG: hypothetical protein WAM69_03720, partial [Candidatus Sulfotelmatobacter sp.]
VTIRKGLAPPQTLLAIAFEAWLVGSACVTAILAPVVPIPQFDHEAELPFVDAIRTLKIRHPALPR